LNQVQEISWWNKILIRMSSWSGILGGLFSIIGIMHTMIINLGRSVAIHEFDHSSTWLVLLIGVIAGLFAFLFYLKNKKIWPELIIAIASIIEIIACLLIIGYFSR
jgi:bacteriorhodopsin